MKNEIIVIAIDLNIMKWFLNISPLIFTFLYLDADVIIDNEKDDVFLERQYGKPSMSVLIKKLSIVAFFFLMLIVSIFIRIYA